MVVEWRFWSLMTEVIEATSPMGGEGQYGGTCWVQYLAPGIADRIGLAVVGLMLRLLKVQMQAQFRSHTLRNLQVMANVLQCISNRAVIQVPYIEL